MRMQWKALPAAVGAFAIACADAVPATDAELLRDLELASTAGLELAASSGEVHAISAIENGARGTVGRSSPRRSTPREVERPVPEPGGPETSLEATEVVAETPVETEAVESVTASATTVDAPAAGRPAPIAVSYPSVGRTSSGASLEEVVGGMAGVILDGVGSGSVIRGGGVGEDRCIPPPRRRRPGAALFVPRPDVPVSINNRIPIQPILSTP